MNDKTTKDYIIVAVKLLIICALVALIVAAVNFITRDKIAFNQKLNTAEALTEIFSDDFGGKKFEVDGDSFIIKDGDSAIARCTAAQCELMDDVTALYIITDNAENPLYYCVAISPMGFKDKINMLVALMPDKTVKGVKIISMSETSGIGTKAQDEGFLSLFCGKDKHNVSEIDTISGATKTSKPVIKAVETSCKQAEAYISLGGEQ